MIGRKLMALGVHQSSKIARRSHILLVPGAHKEKKSRDSNQETNTKPDLQSSYTHENTLDRT